MLDDQPHIIQQMGLSAQFTPVILESPWAAPNTINCSRMHSSHLDSVGSGMQMAPDYTSLDTRRYLQCAMLNALSLGEAPLATHALFAASNILDDADPADRELGMNAGMRWYAYANYVVVYADYGISTGMQLGIDMATALCKPVHYRYIGTIGAPKIKAAETIVGA